MKNANVLPKIGYGRVIAGSIKLYLANFPVLTAATFLCYLLFILPNVYVGYINGRLNEFLKVGIGLVSFIPLYMGSIFINCWIASAAESKPVFGRAAKAMFSRLITYAAASIIMTALLKLGIMFAVVPGVFFSAIYAFGSQAASLADGKTGPLKLSAFLAKGYVRQLMAIALLLSVLPMALTFFFIDGLAANLVYLGVMVFVAPLLQAFSVVLYLRLMEIKKDEISGDAAFKKLKKLPVAAGFAIGVLLWAAYYVVSMTGAEAIKRNEPLSKFVNSLKAVTAEFVDNYRIYVFDYPENFNVEKKVVPETCYVLSDPDAWMINKAYVFRKTYGNDLKKGGFSGEDLKKAVMEMLTNMRSFDADINYFNESGKDAVAEETGLNKYRISGFKQAAGMAYLEMRNDDGKGNYYLMETYCFEGGSGIIAMTFVTDTPLGPKRQEMKEAYEKEKTALVKMWDKTVNKGSPGSR